jgi:hypothetical protein
MIVQIINDGPNDYRPRLANNPLMHGLIQNKACCFLSLFVRYRGDIRGGQQWRPCCPGTRVQRKVG